jgi:hypothetical protein
MYYVIYAVYGSHHYKIIKVITFVPQFGVVQMMAYYVDIDRRAEKFYRMATTSNCARIWQPVRGEHVHDNNKHACFIGVSGFALRGAGAATHIWLAGEGVLPPPRGQMDG